MEASEKNRADERKGREGKGRERKGKGKEQKKSKRKRKEEGKGSRRMEDGEMKRAMPGIIQERRRKGRKETPAEVWVGVAS